jgi:hypothetical protein
MSDDDRDRRREFSSQDWERNRDRNLSGEYSGMKRDRDHFESHDRESPPRKRRRDDWYVLRGHKFIEFLLFFSLVFFFNTSVCLV